MAEPYLKRLTSKIASLDVGTEDGVVLECKHFFSGAALYANGNLCASLSPAGFGLKLPEESRTQLVIQGDGKALRYFEEAPAKKGYVVLSQSFQEDPERLQSLLRQSIAYVVGRRPDA